MNFRDRDMPHPFLEIVGDQQNPNAKVLLLEVQPPAIGVFSLVSGTFDEFLLLKKWSKMDTKDVMRNFLSKATCMKVPLLKSSIHHDVASSKHLILMNFSALGVFLLPTLAMVSTHLVTGNG
ncbi:hypothetical protein H5410_021843 [Solanum commersonii]|uniref:Uncharacterized protein n=1 Tax=Solanum commersonii TaxID=4109 RepID=A0A9J5ZD44_SOLCO|nr:hypothetical protein H5410_021843 [Solanum commersonii]